jgi:hypothetical protein
VAATGRDRHYSESDNADGELRRLLRAGSLKQGARNALGSTSRNAKKGTRLEHLDGAG